jgi:hypothetical protein
MSGNGCVLRPCVATGSGHFERGVMRTVHVRPHAVLAALGLSVLAFPAGAWGPQGHQTVAAIAEALLVGTHARTEVRKILGTETLQTSALWADCVKGVTEKPPYRYVANPRYSECAPFQTAAGKRAMVVYMKRNLSGCHPTAVQEVCHKQYHYADVAVQRSRYAKSEVGASEHDIESAVGACMAVLEGKPSPAPFAIASKQEALRLLAHYVGDLHQPLHVGAVYLDPAGHPVDPDGGTVSQDASTRGGNLLLDASKSLHGEWDSIPAALVVASFRTQGVALARAVPVTAGPMKDWPAAWASETLVASHEAFAGLTFGVERHAGTAQRSWQVVEPAGYAAARSALQTQQIVKAGARLAQVLQTLWP